MDKQALLSTLSESDRIIVNLYEAGVGQKSIAKKIGITHSYVSKHLERLLELIEADIFIWVYYHLVTGMERRKK